MSEGALQAHLINISDEQIIYAGSKVQLHIELKDYVFGLDYMVQFVYQGIEEGGNSVYSAFNHSLSGSYEGNIQKMYAEIDVPTEIDGVPVKLGDYRLKISLKNKNGQVAEIWRDIVLDSPQI